MDAQTNSVLGIAGIVSGMIAAIYTYMKHSKCKGHCCGQAMDMTIDLTPTEEDKNEKLFRPIAIKTPAGDRSGGEESAV
jgi:hypothetical protein